MKGPVPIDRSLRGFSARKADAASRQTPVFDCMHVICYTEILFNRSERSLQGRGGLRTGPGGGVGAGHAGTMRLSRARAL